MTKEVDFEEGAACDISLAALEYQIKKGGVDYHVWNFYDSLALTKDECLHVLGIPKSDWTKKPKTKTPQWTTTHKGKKYIIFAFAKDDYVVYKEGKGTSRE